MTDPGSQMEAAIRVKLDEAFAPVRLDIIDESEAHRGHGGYREGGGTHMRVVLRSAAFDDQSRVARSRAVHRALAEELGGRLHALALDLGGADDP